MAGTLGLDEATWDSASCVRGMRWGSTLVPVLKATPPGLEVKLDRSRAVGEMLGQRRTPGAGEISDASVEVRLSDYVALILPKMPKHGGTLIAWTITLTISHPSVKGSYGQIWEACRITKHDAAPELAADEKTLVKKLGLSVMNHWERGDDGIWKSTFALDLPMSAMAAAFKF